MLLKSTFGERFRLHGDSWPKRFGSSGGIPQKSVAAAYHKSLCSISISHYNNIGHYFSDRLLLSMASGRPVISLKFPKWETYFTNNCDLIIVNSVEEIPGKLKWLKENKDAADFIGKSGADKVKAEHTYLSRVNELLEKIKLQ